MITDDDLEAALRATLARQADAVRVSADGWERITERLVDDRRPLVIRLDTSRRRRAWPVVLTAAAAVVAVVVGVLVLQGDSRRDLDIGPATSAPTVSTPDTVSPVPAWFDAASAPAVHETTMTAADAAAATYLQARLGEFFANVDLDEPIVDGNLATAGWRTYEQPIANEARTPIAAGTVYLRRPTADATWAVVGTFAEGITITRADLYDETAYVTATADTAQASRVRLVDASDDVLGQEEISDGRIDGTFSLPVTDAVALRIEYVGGAVLALSELRLERVELLPFWPYEPVEGPGTGDPEFRDPERAAAAFLDRVAGAQLGDATVSSGDIVHVRSRRYAMELVRQGEYWFGIRATTRGLGVAVTQVEDGYEVEVGSAFAGRLTGFGVAEMPFGIDAPPGDGRRLAPGEWQTIGIDATEVPSVGPVVLWVHVTTDDGTRLVYARRVR